MKGNPKKLDLKKGGSYEKAFEKESKEISKEDLEKAVEEGFQKTGKKTLGKGYEETGQEAC
jgi:hypothetical protein